MAGDTVLGDQDCDNTDAWDFTHSDAAFASTVKLSLILMRVR